jgi:hypothetical protein
MATASKTQTQKGRVNMQKSPLADCGSCRGFCTNGDARFFIRQARE